ncbi:carbohydrate-binding module family 18 protein [Piromyces sp. E2]|nr:carbohydrate-binding module family 18 protein [Piromyces sp. E2]|eukprot:OUM62718.1 carbohydrate-binding module family 18 protein [Piromyces sp. E2]
MIVKLFNIISILLLVTYVSAYFEKYFYSEYEDDDIEIVNNDKGDCKEIKNYFIENGLDNTIDKCVENNNGEVIEIKLSNDNLEQQDVEKILSYNTITSLDYEMYISYDASDSLKKKQSEIPTIIYKLTNLKELTSIKKNVISSLPKDLKKLGLHYINLSQDNINEIATLTSLENLTFSRCEEFDKLDFSPIEKLDKISELKILFSYGRFYSEHSLGKNILKYFKPLKALVLFGMQISQDNINEIGTLTNLEELNIQVNSSVDLKPLMNLNKLSVCILDYYEFIMDESEFEDGDIDYKIDLNLPKNIKKLKIEKIEITQNNIEEISNLSSLEELKITVNPPLNFDSFKKLEYLSLLKLEKIELIQSVVEEIGSCTSLEKLTIVNCLVDDEKLYFDSFKNLKNLLELIFTYDIYVIEDNVKLLKEIPDSFYSLEKLQKLDISSQKITTISDKIVNIKNLKTLNLPNNKISNIPEVLSKLENLEYINLASNEIYDELPESLYNLTKLETLYLNGNLNVKGKTLTNESLKICQYGKNYNLCKAKDLKCLDEFMKEYEFSYEKCTDDNVSNDKTKCGKLYGKCPSGQCCSKDGICGKSESYCLLSEGCQVDYGFCNNECDQIYYYITKRKMDKQFTVSKCLVDDKGKIKEL